MLLDLHDEERRVLQAEVGSPLGVPVLHQAPSLCGDGHEHRYCDESRC